MTASERLADWCSRHPVLVICAFALSAAASVWGATRYLGVEMDPVALLDPTLEWRANALELRERFPHRENTIVAHITAPTPEAADLARAAFFEAMPRGEGWSIDSQGYNDFFASHGLLFRDVDALEALAEQLAGAQPLIGALVRDPSLVGFFGLLSRVAEADQAQLPRWSVLLERVSDVLKVPVDARAPRLSWQSLVLGEGLRQGPKLIVAKPPETLGKRAALSIARDAVQSAQAAHPLTEIRLTGSIPLWIEEIDSAMSGASLAGVVALIAVALLLSVGLRAWQLVLASMLTLVAGLAITLGFATFAVGRLNLISVGFAALFIGLAIDFAVHLCARYREERAWDSAMAVGAALTRAMRAVGGALALCAVSAAAAFFSFSPTAYDGVAELGIIGGAGMIIGWFGALTLLPACVAVLPAAKAPNPARIAVPKQVARVAAIGIEHPRAVRWTAFILAALAAAMATQVRFDYNPMHLKPQGSRALQTYQSLLRTGPSPLNAQLLIADKARADKQAQRLQALAEVGRVVWLERFVPSQQDAKLALIEDMNWSVGFALPQESLQLEAKPVPEAHGAMEEAAQKLRAVPSDSAQRLGEAIPRWLERHGNDAAAGWSELRTRLLGNVPPLLDRLRLQLTAEAVRLETLPPQLRRKWLDDEGYYRLQIEPAINLYRNDALLAFVASVSQVAPTATGAPMEYVYSSRTIIHAFVTAFALALCVITLFLAVLLRSLADTARALVPLLLGSLLLVAAMVLTKLHFNFANVIVLPLLLGISVANGIHVIWRARIDPSVNPVASSAGRAVLVSVATTLASFLALWLSPHRGMSSIGALLGIGLVLQLACTFVVLPSLMRQRVPSTRDA